MTEIAQLISDLLSGGRTGIVILSLAVLIGAAAYVIWLQRQAMGRFDSLVSSVDLSMKAADTARAQSVAVQQEVREGLEKQFDFVLKTNEELRKELERQKLAQAKFEQDVKNALSVGFKELKGTLATVTVSEIVDEIPESFRRDLESEIATTTEKAINNLINRIRDPETGLENEILPREELTKKIEEVADNVYNRMMERYSHQFDDIGNRIRYEIEHALREFLYEARRGRILVYPYDEPAALDYLAEQIARRLKRW